MKVNAGHHHLTQALRCGNGTEVALQSKGTVGTEPTSYSLHVYQSVSQCPWGKGLKPPGEAEGLLRKTKELGADAEDMQQVRLYLEREAEAYLRHLLDADRSNMEAVLPVAHSHAVAVVGSTGLLQLCCWVDSKRRCVLMLTAGKEKGRGAASLAAEAVLPAGTLEARAPAQVYRLPCMDQVRLRPKHEQAHVLPRHLDAHVVVKALGCSA